MGHDKKRRDKKIVLDNASSVLLPLSGQAKKARFMAEYIVRYKGAEVICKSVEDAARLLERLGQNEKNLEWRPWNTADFTDFTNRLETQPRRLLAFLVKIKTATDTQLREHLRLQNNKALAGVLSGVSKVALACDMEPQRVYTQHTNYKAGKPERRYSISPAFKKATEDFDWPSEQDLKWQVEPEDE
jgi:hypothetical protein